MKTLNKTEIEAVVGGMMVAGPIRPRPLPADESVTIGGEPVFALFARR